MDYYNLVGRINGLPDITLDPAAQLMIRRSAANTLGVQLSAVVTELDDMLTTERVALGRIADTIFELAEKGLKKEALELADCAYLPLQLQYMTEKPIPGEKTGVLVGYGIEGELLIGLE